MYVKLTCQISLDTLTVVLMLETTHVGLTGSHFTRWFLLVFVSYIFGVYFNNLLSFLERHLFMHIAFVDKKNSEITCNCFMKLAVIILRSNLQTQCFIKHIGHLSFGSRKKNICTRTCNIKLERFLTRDWFVDRIILDYIFFPSIHAVH